MPRFAALALASAAFAASVGAVTPSTPMFIGYYDANSQGELPSASIPHSGLTHLVLTNALKVDNEGTLRGRKKKHDDELSSSELIARLAALPTKLIINLRGYPDDVAMDELTEDDENRDDFAAKVPDKLAGWGVSGLEIEWHSDDTGGGKPRMAPFDAQEQEHIAEFAQSLSPELRSRGQTLSFAVRPGRQEFADANVVRDTLDWLAIRAFSMRSVEDPHHSSMTDMATALGEWTAMNVSRAQLVLDVPLFARARPGGGLRQNSRDEALHKPWRDIVSGGSKAEDIFLDQAGKAWFASGFNTTRAKVAHVIENGYAGIGFRDLHYDAQSQDLSLVQAAVTASLEQLADTAPKKSPLAARAEDLGLFQRGLTSTVGAESKKALDVLPLPRVDLHDEF